MTVFENWTVSYKIWMLVLGDLVFVSVSLFTSLDVGKIGEGARHGAEAEAIATSVLEGLTCRGLEFGCHADSYLEP